jgi:hypothetical protein
MRPPHLAVVHVDWLPADAFGDFVESVSHQDLELLVQSRENEVYAGVEWLLPTAAFVYISKSYFDGFLKEMGKDHYALLKNGLKALWGKMLGPKAPKPTVISSPGKVSKDQPYSLLYSIMAETGEGHRFKLLLPRDMTQEEYEKTVDGFLDFLEKFHSRNLDASTVEQLASTRVVGNVIPLVYDTSRQAIRTLDPLAGRR